MILCEPTHSDKLPKFVVDHTPKAGCTIAMKIVFDYMNVLDEALEYKHPRKWVHDFRIDKYYDRFGRVNESHVNDSSYIKVKFVRNPFNRAVSSFIHCCKHPFLLAEYEHSNPSFNEFLKLLHSKKLGITCGGGHYRIQNSTPEIPYDEIVKIEDSYTRVSEINAKYNSNWKSEYSSPHHFKKCQRVENFGQRSLAEVNEFMDQHDNRSPSYDSYYCDETFNLVSCIYEHDIKPLGYTRTLEEIALH